MSHSLVAHHMGCRIRQRQVDSGEDLDVCTTCAAYAGETGGRMEHDLRIAAARTKALVGHIADFSEVVPTATRQAL